MATWQKGLLWSLGILVVPIGGGLAVIDHLFSNMCATTIFEEALSPNKQHKAVVFQIDCGATSDFNTHVAVVKATFDKTNAKALPQGFFVADRDHGRAPAGVTNGPEVRLNWESDDKLGVRYHPFARVFRSEEKQDGVTIHYQPFQ